MFWFRSKLVCLSKKSKVPENRKTLAYYKICQFSVDYESVGFYSKK